MDFKKLYRQFLGLFPTRLPVGSSEFHTWAQSIIDTYELPTKDVSSIKFALAAAVVNLESNSVVKSVYKSKRYFYLTLLSAATKQVAGAIFTEIKEEHKKKLAEEKAKRDAEAQQQQGPQEAAKTMVQ